MSTITMGPVGSVGGYPFANYTVPEGARIKAIHVRAATYVDALHIVYIDDAGEAVTMPGIGGMGGAPHVFELEQDEYLTGISGRCGWFIDRLVLHTNKRLSPSYGGLGGEEDFYLTAPQGHELVGFFGRAGWFLDALGIVARPRKPVSMPRTQPTRTTPILPPRSPRPDDLRKVEGIGPKIAAILIENGVLDLRDLAQTTPAQLRSILEAAGRRYALADPSTWPEQAALGAQDKWAELEALQATLIGGRRATP